MGWFGSKKMDEDESVGASFEQLINAGKDIKKIKEDLVKLLELVKDQKKEGVLIKYYILIKDLSRLETSIEKITKITDDELAQFIGIILSEIEKKPKSPYVTIMIPLFNIEFFTVEFFKRFNNVLNLVKDAIQPEMYISLEILQMNSQKFYNNLITKQKVDSTDLHIQIKQLKSKLEEKLH